MNQLEHSASAFRHKKKLEFKLAFLTTSSICILVGYLFLCSLFSTELYILLQNWAQMSTNRTRGQTKKGCCLTPVFSLTLPSALYQWWVVVESLESADLSLIDDAIWGSLPVRAVNFGGRESFGHGSFLGTCLLLLGQLAETVLVKSLTRTQARNQM